MFHMMRVNVLLTLTYMVWAASSTDAKPLSDSTQDVDDLVSLLHKTFHRHADSDAQAQNRDVDISRQFTPSPSDESLATRSSDEKMALEMVDLMKRMFQGESQGKEYTDEWYGGGYDTTDSPGEPWWKRIVGNKPQHSKQQAKQSTGGWDETTDIPDWYKSAGKQQRNQKEKKSTDGWYETTDWPDWYRSEDKLSERLVELLGRVFSGRAVSSTVSPVARQADPTPTVPGNASSSDDYYCRSGLFDEREQSSGTIQSPRYPRRYRNNLSMCWLVGQPGKVTTITFHEPFGVEDDDDGGCYDLVGVYQTDEEHSAIAGPYCGAEVPQPVSFTGEAVVYFETDYSIKDKGFSLSYVTEAVARSNKHKQQHGWEKRSTHGWYETTDQPEGYRSASDEDVALEMVQLLRRMFGGAEQQQQKQYTTQTYDRESNEDNAAVDMMSLLRKMFADSADGKQYTTQSSARQASTVRAVLRDDISALNEICDSVRDMRLSHSGTITSPNYPENYEDAKNTCWVVGQIGKTTTLYFDTFAVEEPWYEGEGCTFDYLAIFQDGSDYPIGGSPFCGMQSPGPVSFRGEALLFFHTDYSDTEPGFSISFANSDGKKAALLKSLRNKLHKDSDSDWDESVEETAVTVNVWEDDRAGSRKHGKDSDSDSDSDWDEAVVDSGVTISVWDDRNGLKKNRDSDSDSDSDWDETVDEQTVTVNVWDDRDAQQSEQQLVGLLSRMFEARNKHQQRGASTTPTFSIWQEHDQEEKSYETRAEEPGSGFEWAEGKCKTGLEDLRGMKAGEIKSHNYPADYTSNRDDCWRIGAAGKMTEIHLDDDFHLEDSDGCYYDYLAVYDVDHGTPARGPYCGRRSPGVVRVRGEAMVMFHADESAGATGFSAQFRSVDENES